MSRPGIMLYFDIRQPLKILPDAEKGRLFDAILEYGENGTTPEFDGMLAMAWGFLQPKLDRDSREYERTVLKRQYAAFCRECKRKGAPEASFDEWAAMGEDRRQQLLSRDTASGPTAAASPAANKAGNGIKTANTIRSVTAAAEEAEGPAAAAADRKLKFMNGELGKGVVVLSEYQVDLLLDKLGVDMFDHYVEKLARFILQNGAAVKSHYTTILRWWTEDSAC